MSWHVCDALPIFSPHCTCNYVFLQCVHAAERRRYVPRSCRSVPRTVKLFVPRQMEAGCLVSGSEDISSLFPEQTPGAKYKVGFLVRVGRLIAGVYMLPCAIIHTRCPFVRIWAASFPPWDKCAGMGTASTEPSASHTWSRSCTMPGLCRGQSSSLLPFVQK